MPSLSRSDTLKILVNALMHEGFSCNTEQLEVVTLMRSKLMQNKKKYYHIFSSAPPSLLGSTRVPSDEEQPSGRSRRAQRCSSGFWQSTEGK